MSALCLEPKFSGDELGSNFPHVLTSVEIEITSWNADSDAKFPIHRMKMVPVYRHANEFCPKENVNLFSPILLWTCLLQLSGSIMNEWVKHFDMCLFSLYMSIIILLFFFFFEKRKSCLLKQLLSHKGVIDSFETSRTVACQALFMGFSRQEYWSGLPFPSPGDLPHPGIEPASPTLWVNSLLLRHQGKLGQERLCFSLYSPKCSGWGTVS